MLKGLCILLIAIIAIFYISSFLFDLIASLFGIIFCVFLVALFIYALFTTAVWIAEGRRRSWLTVFRSLVREK